MRIGPLLSLSVWWQLRPQRVVTLEILATGADWIVTSINLKPVVGCHTSQNGSHSSPELISGLNMIGKKLYYTLLQTLILV